MNFFSQTSRILPSVESTGSRFGPDDAFPPSMARIQTSVAEMQGLYGPYTLPERVLQKIWLQGDFCRHGLRLTDGRPLELLSPGKWNLGGGPDFLGARFRIDGVSATGDVEVHFRAADWAAHGHGANPSFAQVGLHAVLFPPEAGAVPPRSAAGAALPTLVLLPLLHRDMEEYASDDALEALTERDEWRDFSPLAALPAAARHELVGAQAEQRWQQKCRYARLRLARLGWEDAAHQTALEILGYRRNRAGMLAVAGRHPLATWQAGLALDEVWDSGQGYWQLDGIRPANHPRHRLRPSQDWVGRCPDWPARLAGLGRELPGPPRGGRPGTRGVRQAEKLSDWRKRICEVATGGLVGGSRLDTLVCDGFLPLWEAAGSAPGLDGLWYHWYLGDVPDQLKRALARLGLGGFAGCPFSHGAGQGLLGWLIGRQGRTSDW